jgi:hypothetical protein
MKVKWERGGGNEKEMREKEEKKKWREGKKN